MQLTAASGTSNQPDFDPPSGAGTGRRRRRQEDLLADPSEEDDVQPGSGQGSGSRTPQPSRSYVEVASSRVRDEDEELDEAPSRSYRDWAQAQTYGGPTDFQFNTRSYDDEDEALQAALRASMEDLPEDYVMPELPPLNAPPPRREETPPQTEAAPEAPSPAPAASETRESSIAEDTDDEPAAEPSPGELNSPETPALQALTLRRGASSRAPGAIPMTAKSLYVHLSPIELELVCSGSLPKNALYLTCN